jgi:IclR family pca regulon transcriptional regulator
VKTLRKALAVLDAFAATGQPLSVAEVAVRAGVTRPTAHRLVQTLVAEGYLK